MRNAVFQHASELPPQVREALESWFGRTFQPDEKVNIEVWPPIPPAEKLTREEARRRLEELSDRLAERVKHIPQAEIDAAIDEACDYVRHHPE
jgi:RNA binding exosome subunit